MSIEFDGAVTEFRVTSVAPTSDASTGLIGSSLNRLLIGVNVEYINTISEDESWSQKFSFFQDFESSEDLVSVQDELIESIFEQITEDIFNKSFSNW